MTSRSVVMGVFFLGLTPIDVTFADFQPTAAANRQGKVGGDAKAVTSP